MCWVNRYRFLPLPQHQQLLDLLEFHLKFNICSCSYQIDLIWFHWINFRWWFILGSGIALLTDENEQQHTAHMYFEENDRKRTNAAYAMTGKTNSTYVKCIAQNIYRWSKLYSVLLLEPQTSVWYSILSLHNVISRVLFAVHFFVFSRISIFHSSAAQPREFINHKLISFGIYQHNDSIIVRCVLCMCIVYS